MKRFLLKHKKTLLIVFVVAIAVVCLAKVALEYQWQAIWTTLQKSNFTLFLAGSTASIIFYWVLRALRWQTLLRHEGILLPFWQVYLITGISVGSSTITPFQSGEALKVEHLRKYAGGTRLRGYTVFFIERIFDLLTVFGLGILGVSFGFDSGLPQSYFYIAAAIFTAVCLAVPGIIFLFPSEQLNPVRVLLREKWQQKWVLLSAMLLTVFSWLMVIAGWKIALSSVSIEISFLQASSVVSLTTLLVIMSFVPGAIGVSEISIAAILTKMGIAIPLAQTGAVAVRAYTLMILVLTVLHWGMLKFYQKKYR